MKPYKYPGELGRSTSMALLLGPILASGGDQDAREEVALSTIERRWEALLEMLFAHFSIASDNPLRFELLARALAFRHVPAFEFATPKRAGRPKKPREIPLLGGLASLNYLMSLPPTTLKRGRPANPKRRDYLKELAMEVVQVARQNGFTGRGAISKSMKAMLTDIARKKARAPDTYIRRCLPTMRRDFSAAARLFPKIAGKLPR